MFSKRCKGFFPLLLFQERKGKKPRKPHYSVSFLLCFYLFLIFIMQLQRKKMPDKWPLPTFFRVIIPRLSYKRFSCISNRNELSVSRGRGSVFGSLARFWLLSVSRHRIRKIVYVKNRVSSITCLCVSRELDLRRYRRRLYNPGLYSLTSQSHFPFLPEITFFPSRYSVVGGGGGVFLTKLRPFKHDT